MTVFHRQNTTPGSAAHWAAAHQTTSDPLAEHTPNVPPTKLNTLRYCTGTTQLCQGYTNLVRSCWYTGRGCIRKNCRRWAGPSAGPNGGQIYIDGFTGDVASQSLDSRIRITRIRFHPKYDQMGYGASRFARSPERINCTGSSDVGNCVGIQLHKTHSKTCRLAQRRPTTTPSNTAATLVGQVNKKVRLFFNIERAHYRCAEQSSARLVLIPPTTSAIVPESLRCESADPNELESAD